MPTPPIQPDKKKVMIIGGAAFIVIIFILIFQGILPGLQEKDDGSVRIVGELKMWGIFDSESAYETAIGSFKGTYPDVVISYKRFSNIEEYENAIIEALAAQEGPDIFMVQNGSLGRYLNKITPSSLSPATIYNLYPGVVGKDFVRRGSVYALPLSIDTMALIYNKTLLNQGAVVFPPETWEEIGAVIPKLTKLTQDGEIKKAGAAIGGSTKTIDQGEYLLGVLSLQNDGRTSSAIDFMKKFGDSESPAYTWNDEMTPSLDAFAGGDAAMIFNFASALPQLERRNSFVDTKITSFPQFEDAERGVTIAKYWGYVVSSQSRMPNLAWEFITNMAANSAAAESYMKKTGLPPALYTLIDKYIDDEKFGVFARQALIAESFSESEIKSLGSELRRAVNEVNE